MRVIHSDPADKHNFPGLIEALKDADLLVISVRRRSPPREQLDAIRRHLEAGKSLIGIRTASHAFAVRGADQEALANVALAEWTEFDREVLGGNYTGHHGEGPSTQTCSRHQTHHSTIPSASGWWGGWSSVASLYRTGPLSPDAQTLLLGLIPGQRLEPLAWTRLYGDRRARIFYTSLGHESDFADSAFRQLLVNAVAWGLEKGVKAPSTPADAGSAGAVQSSRGHARAGGYGVRWQPPAPYTRNWRGHDLSSVPQRQSNVRSESRRSPMPMRSAPGGP